MRKKGPRRPFPPHTRFLQCYFRKRIETSDSLIEQMLLKYVHAATVAAFKLEVVLFDSSQCQLPVGGNLDYSTGRSSHTSYSQWLQEVETTFGEYRLVPMTASGERGIVCQMQIEPDSIAYLRRYPGTIPAAIQTALEPLLVDLPDPAFSLRWDEEARAWCSRFSLPAELPRTHLRHGRSPESTKPDSPETGRRFLRLNGKSILASEIVPTAVPALGRCFTLQPAQ